MWVELSWHALTENARKALQTLDFRYKKRRLLTSIDVLMVPKAGLEPAHPKAVDFESTASTNFATPALKCVWKTCPLYLRKEPSQQLLLVFSLIGEKKCI